jgi:gliding motility-associated-like protein
MAVATQDLTGTASFAACDDLNIMTAAYGNDPYGGFPGKDPTGGNYSCRIGGRDLNTAACVAFWACDATKYFCNGDINYAYWPSNGQQISQTFLVTAANALVSFDYAVLLCDGNHLAGEQPYFHVSLTDGLGNTLTPTQCYSYYVEAIAGVPPAGFVNTGILSPSDGISPFYAQNWVDNSINLTPYIGQTVTLKFMAAGCIWGGHPAWAYIDVTCGAVDIDVLPANPCAGATSTMTAPPVQNGSYSWSGPGIVGSTTGQSIVVNASGTYFVTVTPSQGAACAYTLSASITFGNLSAPISASANVNCFGGNTGSATVNPSGGNPAYTYAWSPSGGNAATANNLTAGTYTVLVSDAGGCTKTQTVSITQPTALAVTAAQTNLNCNGVCIGTATVTPSGGTPNYTYAWLPSGGASSAASSLCAGNYTVTVTDSKGCTKTQAYNITQPAVLSTTPSQTNLNCNGVCIGTATVTPSGGTPNYTYAWLPSGGASSAASSLCAGNYTVTVTDSKGCTKTQAYNITQPTTLSATPAQTNLNCNGVCIGSATITPSGGTPNYTYAWLPSGGASSAASSLCAGNYTVTVTDSKGCTTTQPYTITQPTTLTTTPTQSNILCKGVCNGAASVAPSGGTPSYTYAWLPSGGASSAASSLCAGNYTVTVTDSKGCSKTQSYNITQPSTSVTVTASATNTGCTVPNGTATANPSGGSPGYTYAWTPSGQTTSTATGLSAGTYSIVITDANGCTKTTTATVITGSGPVIASTASTPAGCALSIGTATVVPSGGTPSYTYSWSPGGQTTQIATGLAGGTYTAVVTDANGCSVSTTVNVISTTPPTATVTSTLAGCSVSNGSATATPSGGSPSYTYVWNNGQTTQTATGLSQGNYTVTVTDANNCSVAGTVSVSGTSAPTVTATATQATCGNNNGSATAAPSGGTPGYSYTWNNGQTTQTATGLGIGIYTVTITDANGCTAITTTPITNANGPSATLTVNGNVLCFGGNDGSATATPSGGSPAYTFVWSNGQTTQTATGLSAGNYTITVLDANACAVISTLSITQPALLTSSTSPVNVSCNGGSNGSATVSPSGGTPSYTYLWDNGQTNATATGLTSGSYSVTVTDANGCTSTNTVSITQPTVLANTFSQTNVSCNGTTTGSATVTPTGGTPNYTYAWLPSGGNSSAATGLAAGSYTATISDSHGCTVTQTVLITQPAALSATFSQTNVNCNGGNNGSATVTPSGGTPGYTYSWSPSGGSGSTATGLTANIYMCTITDANGCSTTVPFTISQPTVLSVTPSQVNVLCNGGNNGTASVAAAGGTPSYTYLWSNGQTLSSVTGLTAGNYSVIVTDANGCTSVSSMTITQPQPITLAVSGNDSVCIGYPTVLSASASGGTPTYTYSWVPGPQSGPSVTVNPTSNTSYTVSMTDANGCASLTQIFNVAVLPSPTALFDTLITGGMYSSSYTLNDLSTGGNSWLWIFGDNTPNDTNQSPAHTFPGAGTYTVTQVVFNQFGCPDTFLLTITIGEGILIPNVFTPDGNGQNDVWYIPNSGMKEFHVEIFDRWGAKVFETTADEIRWDGHSTSGKLLSDGTYYYNLHAILKSGSEEKDYSTTGYVTLLTEKRK